VKQTAYLFDTHALIFWNNQTFVSQEFLTFFDKQVDRGLVFVSTITFWEISLLVQKGRLSISDIHAWKNELLNNTNIRLLSPSPAEMIDSTQLPPYHKDPFDRLLIAQARQRTLTIVTRDREIQKYDVKQIWV
jgi:PIN domain nuclease of toxin-antitoxin system